MLKNVLLVLAITITVFIFGCTQNGYVYPDCSKTPEKCLPDTPLRIQNQTYQTYNVSELLSAEPAFIRENLNKEVSVKGELKYQPRICTQMACLAEPNFTGEMPCNSCGATPTLKEGNQAIELREFKSLPDPGSSQILMLPIARSLNNCKLKQIEIYENGTLVGSKYDSSKCPIKEGDYIAKGILRMENWTINPPVYYIEVSQFNKVEKT